jgi:hypothetical protein
MAKAQVGFMNFIVQPSFEVFELLLPKVHKMVETCKVNKEKWERNVDPYQKKMEMGYQIKEMLKQIDAQLDVKRIKD